MARPLRLEFAGVLYHVTSRGDGLGDIFRPVGDRRVFVDVLAGVWGRFNWIIHAYCLMTNHFHLSDAFVEAMQRKVSHDRDLREVPQAKRRPIPRSLAEYDQRHADRDQAIKAAYASGGYTMQEIGDYFALDQSRISKIVCGVPRRSGEE